MPYLSNSLFHLILNSLAMASGLSDELDLVAALVASDIKRPIDALCISGFNSINFSKNEREHSYDTDRQNCNL